MKIVLADCYHDSDKGGGGMVAGALSAIRHACAEADKEADVSLLFRFSEDDPQRARDSLAQLGAARADFRHVQNDCTRSQQTSGGSCDARCRRNRLQGG